MSTRILTLAGTPHPKARVDSVSPANGVAVFAWLDAGERQLDSGGSVARFSPLTPDENGEFAEVSDETIADAIANIAEPPPDDATVYAAQLAQGYSDVPTGIKLKTTRAAQSKFSDMVNLLTLGQKLGAITQSTEVSFFDFFEAEHASTVAAFEALILRYGLHCKTLFDDYAP